MLSLIKRGAIKDPAVLEEFTHLIKRLKFYLGQSFDEDGNLIVADPNLAIVPVGGLVPFAGANAPSGYLLCDGSQVSRVTYKSLYDVIGTTYGVGDGSTTFTVPDLRQRFPLGVAASGTGNALGATGGNIDHTHSGGSHTHALTVAGTSTAGSHSHSVDSHSHSIGSDGSHTHSFTTGGPSATDSPQEGTGAPLMVAHENHTHSGTTDSDGSHDHGGATGLDSPGTNSGGSHSHTLTGSTDAASGTTGTANPPFLAVNYIIFTGVAA